MRSPFKEVIYFYEGSITQKVFLKLIMNEMILAHPYPPKYVQTEFKYYQIKQMGII